MPRKTWIIVASFIVVLLLCYILLVPAAPLFVRLGVEPVCVQGDFPRLKLVSCGPSRPSAASITPIPLPTLVGERPVPLIFDDDGSPDGMLALLFFLNHPDYDLRAVTISPGEAHPQVFTPLVERFLQAVGRSGIPLGAGRELPLQGENAFPQPWREASDRFWDVELPEAGEPVQVQPAAQLMVDTINGSAEPVALFISGTHTNLAEALRLDPGIRERIAAVYVMGGSVYQPGNIKSAVPDIDNQSAEWNIFVDPLAASEVFASGLPLYLMPLDATDQVSWDETDARAWDEGGSAAGRMAASLLRMRLRSWSADSLIIWDLATAAALTDPRLCPTQPLSLEIELQPGPEQGRTRPVQLPANAQVCLQPDVDQIRLRAAALLGR